MRKLEEASRQQRNHTIDTIVTTLDPTIISPITNSISRSEAVVELVEQNLVRLLTKYGLDPKEYGLATELVCSKVQYGKWSESTPRAGAYVGIAAAGLFGMINLMASGNRENILMMLPLCGIGMAVGGVAGMVLGMMRDLYHGHSAADIISCWGDDSFSSGMEGDTGYIGFDR